MSLPLSKNTIRQRLIQWHNLKQLLTAQKKRNRQLEAENRQLKKLYEHDTQELKAQLEIALLRIADLEKMVFGSKRNRDNDSAHGQSSSADGDEKMSKQRPGSSYQRYVPTDKEVTKIIPHTVSACRHCGGNLSRFEDVIRYAEDIILPQLINKATKTVTNHIIERGYCVKCRPYALNSLTTSHLTTKH